MTPLTDRQAEELCRESDAWSALLRAQPEVPLDDITRRALANHLRRLIQLARERAGANT